ncbi:MAG: exodeoxyribonuclease VII small subunit [Acidimicrobiales bacterium]
MTDDEAADHIGYADAMSELEAILDDLEDDALDVDVLAAKVERASDLIQLCRNRIGAARVQVERVVASLDDAGPGTEDTDDAETLFDGDD